jgi:uncharacterized membrane protein YjgN (DUF898 family)
MARTRWRGVRFGMESAAWGYVLRAIGHYLLTVLTLGILLPRQTFYLEKFMADRTWFGDAKFNQSGRWQSLYPGLKHVFIGLVLCIGGIVLAMIAKLVGLGIFVVFVGYAWLLVGFVYYRIYAFNYLTKNKTLNDQIDFSSNALTSKVVSTVIIGSIIIAIIGGVVLAIFGAFSASMLAFSMPQSPADFDGVTGITLSIVGFFLYIGFLLAMGALSFVLITQPIIAHVVDNAAVAGAQHLNDIQQRSADEGADAEGFADALDIGGAI